MKRLQPWLIAVLKLPGGVTVEQASDAQFEAFAQATCIEIDNANIVEWSFDDRLALINFGLEDGYLENKNNSELQIKSVRSEASETAPRVVASECPDEQEVNRNNDRILGIIDRGEQ